MNDKAAIIDQRPTTNDQRQALCPQVSVHVLIYNGSWERVRATLNSVIMQKDIDFELIVIDDCSKVNLSDKIKDFFSRHDFTNYRIIVHEKNLGIVASCLEAAKLSRAEYTRGLGQGDMFFDEYALRDSYDYMLKTDADVIASKTVFYHAFSNPIEIFAFRSLPQNIKAYDDIDSLRYSYLIQNDIASGASVMFRREVFAEYMSEAVLGGMKYLEDTMIRCMVFDKRRIKFFDRNISFYEFGAGISTAKTGSSLKTKEMFKIWENDRLINEDMLLKRCAEHPSEFSKKLVSSIIQQRAQRVAAKKRYETRQKLKAKLGIAAIPLVLLWNVYKWIKANVFNKGKNFIMTDVNVSTDFANICMNRE